MAWTMATATGWGRRGDGYLGGVRPHVSKCIRWFVCGYTVTAPWGPQIEAMITSIEGGCWSHEPETRKRSRWSDINGQYWVPEPGYAALQAMIPAIEARIEAMATADEAAAAEREARSAEATARDQAARRDYLEHRTIVGADTARTMPAGTVCVLDDRTVQIQRYGRSWREDGADICYAYWRPTARGDVTKYPPMPVVWPSHLPEIKYYPWSGYGSESVQVILSPGDTINIVNSVNQGSYIVAAIKPMGRNLRLYCRPVPAEDAVDAIRLRMSPMGTDQHVPYVHADAAAD